MTILHDNDLAQLDLKLLRMFDALYSTRHVTRAAEQLGQSQPTVSIWLAKLRAVLHDQLFVRTPEGMQPTPRADAAIGPVRDALQALRRISALNAAFTPATSTRKFAICMTDASHVTLLPALLGHLREAAPLVTIEAARIDMDTGPALRDGRAALALGLIPDLDAEFYQQALFVQDWVCLVNPRHRSIGAALTVQAYQEESHISIASGTGYLLLERALMEQQITRRVRLELPGFLGLAAIVASTDLVATLPRHIGQTLARAGGLRLLGCPFSVPSFAVKLHWHARYHEEPGNRWLRGVCAHLFQQKMVNSSI